MNNKEQYIVSLTSFPARINYVGKALESLVNQKTDIEYKIVLTLAEPQFLDKKLPEYLVRLISEYNIELLWHPTDIRSHKKLIPTLKKYPDATIIITDDDIIRQDWWLQMFIDNHREYPTDIIVGYSAWRLGEDFKQTSATKERQKGFSFRCVTEPNKVLNTERPANGLGGVLYPKHTFTDKRFFDEELFMKLSPYSDESWQYCFNVIEGRTLRMCSKPTEWSKNIIKGTESSALSKHNTQSEYTKLYSLLFEQFPEYKTNMKKRLGVDNIQKEIVPKQPEVICQLTGRFGNILFKVATAEYYAKKHNMKVKYYFAWTTDRDYNQFELYNINTILKENLNLLSKKEAFTNCLPIFETSKEESSITYTELDYEPGKDIHITGNRQSEKYFNKDFAYSLFNFTDIDKEVDFLYGDLSNTGAIHIRRTDYISNNSKYISLTEEDVYKIREKFPDDDFIIFSDDIEWCKNKFSSMKFRFPPTNYSNFNDSLIEFSAMRKCMAIIMSNSTFAWWTAYLSRRPGHITVYKNPWFSNESINDIIPNDKSWITFERFLNL